MAEKFLSNWLTFCLYDHVKQVAGKPLFMLYRAIKTTIETGPVDIVNYQARYALSEDRLLRQKIDFKVCGEREKGSCYMELVALALYYKL